MNLHHESFSGTNPGKTALLEHGWHPLIYVMEDAIRRTEKNPWLTLHYPIINTRRRIH
jgi:hypothetical protein